jgi:hypothetical protein
MVHDSVLICYTIKGAAVMTELKAVFDILLGRECFEDFKRHVPLTQRYLRTGLFKTPY